jgi:hypothetical protein
MSPANLARLKAVMIMSAATLSAFCLTSTMFGVHHFVAAYQQCGV